MSVGTAIEQTCRYCSYEVSSATAAQFRPARRTYPSECRQCGGQLVPVGGDDGD